MKRLLLAVILVPGTAHAADPAWHGVWQGTIGTLPVRACLQQRGAGFANGSYFYLSRLRPIPLSRDDDGSWTEEADGGEPSTGRWVIEAVGPARLTGTWRGRSGPLPIDLRSVATAEADETPCGTTAFIAPRLLPVRVTSRSVARDGFAYREQTYDVGPNFSDVIISSFAFPPARPGDRAINAALRIDPAELDGAADYAGCMKMALGSLGRDGDFHFSYAPVLVMPEYLSVAAASGGFCGGAHPFESTTHLTFDRGSGERIDLGRWFAPSGVEAAGGEDATSIRKIAPALRSVVLRHFPFGQGEEPACRDAVSGADYWDLALSRRGIAFAPSLPHVAQACMETSVVSFAELAPFLSAEGRQEAERLSR